MATDLAKAPVTTALQDQLFLRELAKVTPKSIGLTPERIARIAVTCIKTNPAIGDCSKDSILGCVMLCAQFGFDPGGPSGLAYLVPYGGTCTFIIGYKGLIQLAVRSGTVEKIEAVLIREGDEFTVTRGSSPQIQHKPDWRNGGEVIGAYAIATLKSGTTQFEVMNAIDIRAVESRSRAKSGPWKTDWNEMARKTVVRRLCKYLVLTPEIQEAIGQDDAAEHGFEQTLPVIDVQYTETGKATTRSEATAAKLKAAKPVTPTPEIETSEVVLPPEPSDKVWELESLLLDSNDGDTFTVIADHDKLRDNFNEAAIGVMVNGTELAAKIIVERFDKAEIKKALKVKFTGGQVTFTNGARLFRALEAVAV